MVDKSLHLSPMEKVNLGRDWLSIHAGPQSKTFDVLKALATPNDAKYEGSSAFIYIFPVVNRDFLVIYHRSHVLKSPFAMANRGL
jgi:hypothetical protein